MTQTTVAPITSATNTTLVAAPGAGQLLRIHQIAIGVTDIGTGFRITLEDGAGGDQVFSYQAAGRGDVFTFEEPLVLSENTLLNGLTEGTAGEFNITVWHQG